MRVLFHIKSERKAGNLRGVAARVERINDERVKGRKGGEGEKKRRRR